MGRRPSNKPTSFDIAYLAGVSQPTVSRALRGSKSVSLATRQKIEAIARQLDYTVDKNASSLRSQRSNTLALLFFEDPTPDDSNINPFFLSMLGSITRQCAAHGLDLLISFQKLDDDWHKKYQESHRADGLILLGYGDYTIYESRLRQLVRSGTHFVRWGSVDDGMIGATVGSDNFGAGRLVGEHLLARGRRSIAFLGQADSHYPEFERRYAGLVRALETAGIAQDADLVVDAISSEQIGYDAARTLLSRGKPFDAIFAASDLIAIGAMRALAEAGLHVPGDVAVVGFDDLPAASLTSPPLTTVMQDMRQAGAALVETVLAQTEDKPLPVAVLPTRLVVRGSTGG
ncbi:LacI family DNA-binding transcriptional regulator [Novosphingobium sp. KCTC 2891]|uniref:LacI family DNA-binding transcriptional regulator n=1 Tax=Novosphingobium sp. KCTC 2891 TaxID=2989730 RepID=UPI002221861B|nr:LacI family DNA-binding transcriptional regulator [Novosphingobium sp. KCTC 2891]MCW1383462.1 LacI family DNA-binding transcriptional regulator [Novosphingobium sp. KCTC 2891]